MLARQSRQLASRKKGRARCRCCGRNCAVNVAAKCSTERNPDNCCRRERVGIPADRNVARVNSGCDRSSGPRSAPVRWYGTTRGVSRWQPNRFQSVDRRSGGGCANRPVAFGHRMPGRPNALERLVGTCLEPLVEHLSNRASPLAFIYFRILVRRRPTHC